MRALRLNQTAKLLAVKPKTISSKMLKALCGAERNCRVIIIKIIRYSYSTVQNGKYL